MGDKKSIKKRNWAFVAYPDSVPEGWKDILSKSGLPCAISPLHDKDIDPTGLPKKPHWHVIVCYSGPTSYNVVQSLTESLHATIPQPLEQVKGYYRYLTHKDNPEKAQYDESQIIMVNGFSILDFADPTKSEVIAAKQSLQRLILDMDIIEYSDFMDYLLYNGHGIEYDVASGNTYFFERYISSRRNKRKTE